MVRLVPSKEQRTLKNVNNCLNTNIVSYLETLNGSSSNLYWNVAHLFNTSVNYTSEAAWYSYCPALVSNMCCSIVEHLKKAPGLSPGKLARCKHSRLFQCENKCFTLELPANIRLLLNNFLRQNTLAYFAAVSVTKKKSNNYIYAS